MKIIFTGYGKGKTSAAAGIAFRSWGHGRRVLVVLFLKDQRVSGEWKATQQINSPRLVVKSFGRPCPYLGQPCCPGQQECIVSPGQWNSADEEQAIQGLNFVQQEIKSGQWNLIVADEILNLWSIWPPSQPVIKEILGEAPAEVDLIVTGRSRIPELEQAADLVTNMEMVKHPFTMGITAKKGIDY